MFPIRYFCARMFAPRYFPEVGAGTGDGVRAYSVTTFQATFTISGTVTSTTVTRTTQE